MDKLSDKITSQNNRTRLYNRFPGLNNKLPVYGGPLRKQISQWLSVADWELLGNGIPVMDKRIFPL